MPIIPIRMNAKLMRISVHSGIVFEYIRVGDKKSDRAAFLFVILYQQKY